MRLRDLLLMGEYMIELIIVQNISDKLVASPASARLTVLAVRAVYIAAQVSHAHNRPRFAAHIRGELCGCDRGSACVIMAERVRTV